MPAPTGVWVDSQTEPFEGRGKTKRTSDSVDDIESNPERPEILDESCRRRHELSPPLTSLSGQKLKKLKKLHQVGTIWGIIIDEISAVTYTFFHETGKRFQRIMDCTLPFGGLCLRLWSILGALGSPGSLRC